MGKFFDPAGDVIWTPGKELLYRIKKYRELLKDGVIRAAPLGIQGLFRYEVIDSIDGHAVFDSGWQPNLILNAGLDLIHGASGANSGKACHVGSGTAAPAATQTILVSWVASTGSWVNVAQTSSGTLYRESYFRYDFATGAINGNISEVGINGSTANGSTLFSRELIRDASGNPTTIAISSTQALRVHHKLRAYPPTAVAGSLNAIIQGVSTPITFTIGPITGDMTRWSLRPGSTSQNPYLGNYSAGRTDGYNHAYLNGTATPSSTSNGSYTAGSYSQINQAVWNPGNFTGSVNTIYFPLGGADYNYDAYTTGGAMQVTGITPVIPKGANDTFTLQFQPSWGRFAGPY